MIISMCLVIVFNYMHILNILRNKRLPNQQKLVYLSKIEFSSTLVARQRTLHVVCLLSTSPLQNIANTLFCVKGKIKGPLLYCFSFEKILNSRLLSQKYRQCERA